MKTENIARLLEPITVAQAFLAIRVLLRMLRSAGGERITPEEAQHASEDPVTVIVPVLNEYDRLSPCLEGLIAQGKEVAEILVVDGGSSDGTQTLVSMYAQRDCRIQVIDASPVPSEWNGKAWGLQVGLLSARPDTKWILTIDADVRPRPLLVRSLLGRAKRATISALSVATLQEIEGIGEGLLHPSLLTTLVYRFGIPGKASCNVHEVQANGQCFLLRRNVLESCGGFEAAHNSLCEDITLARTLVTNGHPVGFYEAGEMVSVKMYADWRDTWRNWPRSLPMRDQFSGFHTLIGWLEIALVQALPLPILLLLALTSKRRNWPTMLNVMLVAMRLGVLSGTARAYRHRPWSYWLSPLCDLPVSMQLGRCALQRRHIWRGRILVRGGKS